MTPGTSTTICKYVSTGNVFIYSFYGEVGSEAPTSGDAFLTHQSQMVLIDVAKEGHPQFHLLSRVNQMGLRDKLNSAPRENLVGDGDVRYAIVENGTRRGELVPFRNGQHESYSTAVKERHVGRAEQELHAQCFSLKTGGSLQIRDRD